MVETKTIVRQLTILSDISNIKSVRQTLLAEMALCGFDEESKMAIAVAIDECLTNAIKHGNRNNKKLTVEINYKINFELIEVSIKDKGCGFNWKENLHLSGDENFTGYELGGRGLFMISNMMNSVNYNDSGNQITIIKNNANCLK